MATRLKALKITKIALVPKGANELAHVLLYKSATPPEEDPMAETVLKADYDAVLVKLKTAQESIATLTEQVKKLTPPDPEDIWKGVSPVLKAKFDEQERRAKAAEEAIAVEKAAREKVLYIAKARSYKYLPINPDDDWEVFKGLGTLPAPVQERLDTLFKAAEENGRQAKLTIPWGRDGVPTGSDAPLAQLEALGRSYVTKGLAKSESEGMERAIRDRQDLYNAHVKAVRQDGKE